VSQYICFQVAEARYALPLASVVQVLRFENLTSVPMAPPFVEGILNLGGEVVPVVNLRSRLGLERGTPGRRSRVLVVEEGGARHGLLVDGVREILELEEASILRSAAQLAGLKAELVAGIAKVRETLVVILEAARLLAPEAGRGAPPELPELEQAEEAGSAAL
jgi:purine-binding chemotaxis protein CheW